MDVSMVSQWTALVVAVGGAAVAFIRIWTKMKIANKGDSTTSAISNQLLENLRDEIKRLDGVIAGLAGQLAQMNITINEIRNLEIHAAADFGALDMIAQTMPCNACMNQGEPFVQLQDVVARMKVRRRERQALIEEVIQ